MKILVYIEYDNHSKDLKSAGLAAINAAYQLKNKMPSGQAEVDVILFSHNQISYQDLQLSPAMVSVKNIYLCIDNNYEHMLHCHILPSLIEVSSQYDYIIASSNFTTRAIMPILAAHYQVPLISDVIQICSADHFKRLIYTGNAIANIKVNSAKKILTVRASCFAAPSHIADLDQTIDGVQHPKIIDLAFKDSNPALPLIKLLNKQSSRQENVNLDNAKIIITGGRALRSAGQFKEILFPLAKKLNAAIGATRAAVDENFAPNEWQIGQTGKIVAPELYIAIGLSGAQQHLAGMRGSKIIVAINKDIEAPIVQIADYALIGDLFEIVPQLTEAI